MYYKNLFEKILAATIQNKVNIFEFTIRARNRDDLIDKVRSLYKMADVLQKRSGMHNIFAMKERNEEGSYNQVWLLFIENHFMPYASVKKLLY